MSNFNNYPTTWLSDSTANKYIKSYFKGNVDINEGDLVVRGKNKINVWNHEIKADFIDVLSLPPSSTGLTLVYPSLSVTYTATSQANSFQNGSYTISSLGNYNDSTTGINKLFDKDINTAYSSPLNSYNVNTGISQFNNFTNTTYQGEYFQIQFPYQFYLTSYQLRPISPFTQFPTLFYLFGSTNGTTWTLIDTENQTTPTNNNLITYTLTASESYSYYRVVVNKIGIGQTYLSVAEMLLNGYYDNNSLITNNLKLSGDLTLTNKRLKNDTFNLNFPVQTADRTIATTNDLTPYQLVSGMSDYALKTYVDTKVSALVNSAPATLDTLNELATALGNDANFSTTVTSLIGTKQNTLTNNSIQDIWLSSNVALKNVANAWTGTNAFNTSFPTSTLLSSTAVTSSSIMNKAKMDTLYQAVGSYTTPSSNNTWTGTNSFNTSFPTSTLPNTTAVTNNSIMNKAKMDTLYQAVGSYTTPSSNNAWTGTNSFNTSFPTSTLPNTTAVTNDSIMNKAKMDTLYQAVGSYTTPSSNNTWTGTNAFNTSLPTSSITSATNGNQFITKTIADNLYLTSATGLTIGQVQSNNNTWTGTNAFNTSLPTSTISSATGNQFITKTIADNAYQPVGSYATLTGTQTLTNKTLTDTNQIKFSTTNPNDRRQITLYENSTTNHAENYFIGISPYAIHYNIQNVTTPSISSHRFTIGSGTTYTDYLTINSNGTTINTSNLTITNGNLVFTTGNKTITNGTGNVLTLPTTTTTLIGNNTTDTLTNKTIASLKSNATTTLNFPTFGTTTTDTLVSLTASQTLTNKTLIDTNQIKFSTTNPNDRRQITLYENSTSNHASNYFIGISPYAIHYNIQNVTTPSLSSHRFTIGSGTTYTDYLTINSNGTTINTSNLTITNGNEIRIYDSGNGNYGKIKAETQSGSITTIIYDAESHSFKIDGNEIFRIDRNLLSGLTSTQIKGDVYINSGLLRVYNTSNTNYNEIKQNLFVTEINNEAFDATTNTHAIKFRTKTNASTIVDNVIIQPTQTTINQKMYCNGGIFLPSSPALFFNSSVVLNTPAYSIFVDTDNLYIRNGKDTDKSIVFDYATQSAYYRFFKMNRFENYSYVPLKINCSYLSSENNSLVLNHNGFISEISNDSYDATTNTHAIKFRTKTNASTIVDNVIIQPTQTTFNNNIVQSGANVIYQSGTSTNILKGTDFTGLVNVLNGNLFRVYNPSSTNFLQIYQYLYGSYIDNLTNYLTPNNNGLQSISLRTCHATTGNPIENLVIQPGGVTVRPDLIVTQNLQVDGNNLTFSSGTGVIKNGTYDLTLPSKTGTIAVISDIPRFVKGSAFVPQLTNGQGATMTINCGDIITSSANNSGFFNIVVNTCNITDPNNVNLMCQGVQYQSWDMIEVLPGAQSIRYVNFRIFVRLRHLSVNTNTIPANSQRISYIIHLP